jgi:rhamnulokinase
MKYYLAIDIGASSGRHIVGWMEDGKLKTKEVYRFQNGVQKQNGHLVWDINALLFHVKAGIAAAKAEFPNIVSLSIDTWGVDYVLLRGDEEVLPVYAYRDSRTEAVIPKVHEILPFSRLYCHTGCQFQPFNSIYQLYADKINGRLDGVTDFLMLPEYLLRKLCGVKAKEYTNATTTGLVNAESGEFDTEIITALGLPAHLFPKLRPPKTILGEYEGIKCILCATHDTASAVEGIPMKENSPYISSGTWSLLGVKTPRPITDDASRIANYSNEGGVGYNRYQKNIMGMWLVNRLKEELCPEMPFSQLVTLAEKSSFAKTVDANAPEFLSPVSMKAAFDAALGEVPQSSGDYFCCAYRSLAVSYAKALSELERNTGRTYEKLYIVGGGAKNEFLNRLTAKATGKQVIALPIEATALGNLKIQMEADV